MLNSYHTPLDYAKATIETMMRKYAAPDLPPTDCFHYHQGVFLDGVYRNYQLSGEESWFQYIKDWMDYMVDENGQVRYRFHNCLDCLQPGNLLFPLYEKTGDLRYKTLLTEILKRLRDYPRTAAGTFRHTIRINQLWLDGLYMADPLLCKCAAFFDLPEYYDLATTHALTMQKKTLDPETGLLFHAYDDNHTEPWADPVTGCSSEFWGRSIGWVPVAVLEMLELLPKDHPDYQPLCDMVRGLLTALCKYQSEEGRWYQIVNKGDQPDNWLENSCSCLYTAALYSAIVKGILDISYLPKARKAYNAVINSITRQEDDIQIGQVSVGTCVGDYEYYVNREVSVNDLHGVGAFLIMCAEVQKAETILQNYKRSL